MIKNKFLKIILYPISALWAFLYWLRRFCFNYKIFKKDYFKVPIVSVGNISFGGTGKTPMIIWLSKKIEELNLTPMVLTRGYKSELEKSSGIIKAQDSFLASSKVLGDEPLMIAKSMSRGAVVIGSKRAENLKKYFDDVQADIVFLDDGFQHLKIHRSFNLVLFDSNMDISNYKTAPLGYLREGLSSLKFADAIAFSRSDQVSSEEIDKIIKFLRPHLKENVLISKFYYSPVGIFDITDELIMQMSDLSGKNVISVTALASPRSFNQSLEDAGANIVESKVYKDHHFFSKDDLKEIQALAKSHDAIILTTKKDIVKLKNITQDSNIFYVDVSVKFSAGGDAIVNKMRQILKLDSI